MKKTLILDSTQIDTFLTCPEMWNLRFQENLTLSNETKRDLLLGSYGHEILDRYYKTKFNEPRNPKVYQDSARASSPKFKGKLDTSDMILVETTLQQYDYRYCTCDFTTAFNTIPSLKEIDGLLYDVPINNPLIEQGFSYELLNNDDYLFILEGRIDWIIDINGQLAFVDHKFQSRERELYRKSIQFRNYALATGLNLGVVNYIRFHKDVKANTFVRQTLNFSAMESVNWKKELIEIYKEIANNTRQRNRAACAGKYGYPCEFTSICEEYNPFIREAIKQSKYVTKVEWRPW